MDENLVKSLTDLIDETLAEIEDLKKSDRFSASEIKIEGPGDGISGKPVNGSIETKKADEKEDEDEEEKKKKEEMEKGVNEEEDEVSKGVNEEKEVSKADEEEEEDEEEEDEKKVKKSKKSEDNLKKSEETSEALMKSYVDSRISPMEEKISSMLEMIKELADSPVERKGVPAGVQPLHKSASETTPLNKNMVIDQLMDLKKSNSSSVKTEDITRAELGGPADLDDLVRKYKLEG